MFETTKVILEIEKTCRTCLTEKPADELTSIWENHLNSRIRDVTSVELKENSILPNKICTECLKSLNIAGNFQKQVEDSEFQLRNLIVDEESNQLMVAYKCCTLLEDNWISENSLGVLKEINPKHFEDSALMVESNNDKVQKVFVDFLQYKEDDSKSAAKDILGTPEDITVTGNPSAALNYFIAEAAPSDTILNSNNMMKWPESHSAHLSPEEECSKQDIELRLVTAKVEPEETSPCKNANFSCDLCSKTFRFEYIYKKHLLKHGNPMKCELCLSSFQDATEYLFHVKKNHPSLKPFSCPKCNESFHTMTPLKVHFNRHSNGNEKKFECNVCGRSFSKRSSLITHQKNHTNPESFKCKVCGKKLAGQHSLLNHLKIHQGDKKHKCDTCGATFIHRFSLRAHWRTHTGEKPFECNVCKNTFKTSSYLKIHKRTHTAEKPYQCTKCSKSFVCKSALVAHEKAHTGEKKFQCDICGWRSGRSSDLRIHLRKHSGEKPYTCEMCSKRYKTTSHLAAHRKTHSGLKEHVCNICAKAFGDPRTLKSHIRIHTGETPYMCHVCGRRFKQSGQLSSHRKIHQIRVAKE